LPDSFAGFKDAIAGTFQKGVKVTADNRPYAVADTQAAVRMVRQSAQAWGIVPDKIGILGFSAGAVTVLATTQANAPDARPDFVAWSMARRKGPMCPPMRRRCSR
jgi:acetyl esterase/lipase